MKHFFLLMSIVVAGCATVEDLSRNTPFVEKVGQILSTQRVTYVYDFDADKAPKELWDHTHKSNHSDDVGQIATCMSGSQFQLQRVLRVRRFNNPESIEARGRIKCGEQLYDVSYVWGQWNTIIDAPWESSQYDPRRTRQIDDDGT